MTKGGFWSNIICIILPLFFGGIMKTINLAHFITDI